MVGIYELIRKAEVPHDIVTFSMFDIFSADYDMYAISCYLPNNTSNSQIYMRLLDSSGNQLTDTNYDSHNKDLRADTGATDSIESGTLSYWRRPFGNSTTQSGATGMMYIYNPFSTTYPTSATSQSIYQYNTTMEYVRGSFRRRIVEQNTGISLVRLTSDRRFAGVVSVFGIK